MSVWYTAWLKPILRRSNNIFRRKIRYVMIIKSFSKTLLNGGRTDVGLTTLTRDPCLKMGITLAISRLSGKILCLMGKNYIRYSTKV